jgi:uncharacterized protein (TIGR02145 family)
MKKLIEKYLIIIVLLFYILLGCEKEKKAVVPVITTTSVSNIAAITAVSGGNITSDGGATVTTRGVCWGIGITPTITDNKTTNGAGAGSFTSNLTGLTEATNYYVRAYATNSAGTGYGMAMAFTTFGQSPTPTNAAATNITTTGATINGSVNANYVSTVVSFEYGTTSSYGSTIAALQSPLTGNTITNVNASLTSLSEGTTYHYRIKAVNTLGTNFSSDITFTTLGQAPVATTQPATNVNTSSATLNGSVNANHLSSVVTFEYGITTNYGSTLTSTQSPVTGNATTSVSVPLSALAPNTTYHFRVKSVNSLGTNYGNDLSFTTLGQSPIAITQASSNITTSSATINGIVNANFLSTTVTFEYGTTTSYSGTATATQIPVTGNTNTNVSAPITALTEGTTYHFRVKAVNSLGTTYGDDLTFITLGQPPIAATQTATDIQPFTSTLNGTINPNYLSTTVSFEYGITTGYGSIATAIQNPVTGSTNTNVNVPITGLTEATIYHFRIIAVNSLGTTYGSDMTFTTLGQPPIVATLAATNTSPISAQLNGTVNSNYLSTIVTFEYGITTSYGNTSNATQSLVTGSTNANVNTIITGLTFGTTYHYRITAVNSLGTDYGSDMTFKAMSSVADMDGNVYYVITIGTQIWIEENLKTTRYKDGTNIPLVTDYVAWANLSPGFCWYNNNEASYKDTYGALYNWYTVNTGKLCPTGWHVPTDADWTTLINYLGGEIVAGGKLKEIGTTHWTTPNTGATNQDGFLALPGGYRDFDGTFFYIGNVGNWWSSSAIDANSAFNRLIRYNETYVDRGGPTKTLGNSVRCVKD